MSKQLNRARRAVIATLAAACFLPNATVALLASAPRPAASWTRPPTASDAVAVVHSLVVNGENRLSALPEDIKLIRAGTSEPAASVEVKTELRKGDRIRTEQGDQLELRYPKSPDGKENVIYLDSKTEVEIGSLCVRSGSILAWVGINFKICAGNTKLGVRGTEFEVHYREGEALKVAVFDGRVDLEPTDPSRPLVAPSAQMSGTTPTATPVPAGQNVEPVVVPAKKELIIVSEARGQRIEWKALTQDEGKSRIDYWSQLIIKADATGAANKANLNYRDTAARNREFTDARFKALWEGDAGSLETLGKIYNDWGEGHKASQQLYLAAQKNPALRNTADFRVNVGEASRLTGNFAAALGNLDAALKIDRNNSQAAYVKAKVFLEQYQRQPSGTALLEEAVANFSRAVQVDTTGAVLDKSKARKELNESFQTVITDFQSHQNDWVSGEKWWCQGGVTGGATYAGRVNLDTPELRTLGVNVSGPAVININGNQFTLTSGAKTLNGRIFGKTTGTYTSVFMALDDPRGTTQLPIILSFQDVGRCGQLILKSAVSGPRAYSLMLSR